MRPHPGEITKLLPGIKQVPSGHPSRTQGTPKLKRGQGNGSLGHPGMDIAPKPKSEGKGKGTMSRPVACPLEAAGALGMTQRQEGRGLQGLWGRCWHL